MPTYSIKTELKLKEELDEKQKGEVIQYALNPRRELQKCYSTIGDLVRDNKHHKNLNWRLAELLEQQAKYLMRAKDLEMALLKIRAKEQLQLFIESNKFL